MKTSRGFALTAEAILALLAAASFLLLLPTTVSPPPSQALYSYQLAQDLLETGVKARMQQIVDFADGDLAAKASLEAHYSSIIPLLGRYCLVLKAKGNLLHAGCSAVDEKDFRQSVSAYRTLLDSQGNWFEVEVQLKY